MPRSRPVLRRASSVDSINTYVTTKSRSRIFPSRAASRSSVYTFRSRAGTQSQSRRPTISGPSDFRMVSSALGNITHVEAVPLPQVSTLAAPSIKTTTIVFRPLELSIHAPGGQLSPLPTFSPALLKPERAYRPHRTSSLSDIPSPISPTFPTINPHRRSLSAPIPVHVSQIITRKPLPIRRDTIIEDEESANNEARFSVYTEASADPSSFYTHQGATVPEVRPPVPLKTTLTLPSPIFPYIDNGEPKSAFSSPSTAVTGSATFSPLTHHEYTPEFAFSPANSEEEWAASLVPETPPPIVSPSKSTSLLSTISRSVSSHISSIRKPGKPHFPRRQLTYEEDFDALTVPHPISVKRPITAPQTAVVPTYGQLLAQRQRQRQSELESISCPSLMSAGRSRGDSDSTWQSSKTAGSNWVSREKDDEAWGQGLGVEWGVAY